MLRAVAADSVKDVALFRVDSRDPQKLVAVCLYATVLELSHSELVLLARGQTSALAVMLGSLLEAYADLLTLHADPGYCNDMYASFANEKRRLLRNAEQSRGRPLLRDIDVGADVAAELQRLKAELQGVVDDVRGQKSSRQHLDSGKLDRDYLSIHWWLCLQSHKNMSALDARHIERDGDSHRVVLFRRAVPGDLARIVETLTGVLIDSAILLHEAFGTGAAPRYQSYKEIFDAVREEYSAAAG